MCQHTAGFWTDDPRDLHFRRSFLQKVGVPGPLQSSQEIRDAINRLNLTSERMEILRYGHKLPTEVTRFQPAEVRNDLHLREPDTRYIAYESRKLVTCDLEIIQAFHDAYGELPPSFATAGPREQLFFQPRNVNVGIAVSGGTAPGVNAVIHWLVSRHCETYELRPGKSVYGFIDGFKGLSLSIPKNYVNLRPELTQRYMHEPGCFLGQSRFEADPATVEKMVQTLKMMDIKILYVLGGDGSLEGAYKIWQQVQHAKLQISVVGVPKTIDNDILWCWHSLGFETAMHASANAINAFHANVKTNGRIGVVILFGGRAGFLATMASLASGRVDLFVIPERTVTLDEIKKRIGDLVSREGEDTNPKKDHALVVVAEGAAHVGDFLELVAEELGEPAYKLAQFGSKYDEHIIREALHRSLKRFFDLPGVNRGHTPAFVEPRGLVHSVPPLASDVLKAHRLATAAVDNALAGFSGFMPSYWLTEIVLVPLQIVRPGVKRLNRGVLLAQALECAGQSQRGVTTG
jgi:6-phosphofructokinase 1